MEKKNRKILKKLYKDVEQLNSLDLRKLNKTKKKIVVAAVLQVIEASIVLVDLVNE